MNIAFNIPSYLWKKTNQQFIDKKLFKTQVGLYKSTLDSTITLLSDQLENSLSIEPRARSWKKSHVLRRLTRIDGDMYIKCTKKYLFFIRTVF